MDRVYRIEAPRDALYDSNCVEGARTRCGDAAATSPAARSGNLRSCYLSLKNTRSLLRCETRRKNIQLGGSRTRRRSNDGPGGKRHYWPSLPPPPTTDGASVRLEKKLSAGGFSAISLNSAKDLRDKADFQALEWVNWLGDSEGLARRSHIRSLVLTDCADAYEHVKAEGKKFGLEMLKEFRSRIRLRRSGGGATLCDCLDEHREGYAYVLTGECKVWWSIPFPVM